MSLLRNHLPAVQVSNLFRASLILKELSAGTGIISLAAIFRTGGFPLGNQRSHMGMRSLRNLFTAEVLEFLNSLSNLLLTVKGRTGKSSRGALVLSCFCQNHLSLLRRDLDGHPT